MALDLKIEVLAYELFNTFWIREGLIETAPTILEVYGDESLEKINLEEVCDKGFLIAICIRCLMFRKLYLAEITDEKAKSLKSLLDCYEFVNHTCDREDLFGHLTIFPRMFATLTFVVRFCFQIREISQDIDSVKYGYLLWVMYFDKFTEEFYEKGGWAGLKRESYFYVNILPFCLQFNSNYFIHRKVRQAIVNFCRYSDAVHIQKRGSSFHTTKLWIKFRIEHFDSYVRIPLSYELTLNAFEAEVLLENLMIIFDPSGPIFDNMNMSEEKCQGHARPSNSKLDSSSENLKTNVDTKTRPLTFEYEKGIINKAPDGFSNINSDFENQARIKCAISSKKVLTHDVTDKNQCLEFDKNSLAMAESPKQTSSEDLTKNLLMKSNSLPTLNNNKLSGTSIKYPATISDLDNSCRNSFVNKNVETENFCAGSIENQDKIANTAQVFSLKKIQEKSSSENASALKDFISENVDVDKDDERKRTRKAREDLRNEQNDPEIKNFLKMLLILDDKEGTKFLLSKLQNKEEHSKILQENTKEQKKKSKKKKNKK